MKKKQTVIQCDICGKKANDEGEMWIGGHPFYGWFHVVMHGGPTDLESLRAPHAWDICSKKCLGIFATTGVPKKADTICKS